jgi:hypothetical protein
MLKKWHYNIIPKLLMSETNSKEQSSGEMIKINNKMNLRELFRRVDFVLILIAGMLFLGFCVYQDFIHDKTFIGRHDGYRSVSDCGIGIMIVFGIFAHGRWKFVYGSEEHRQKVRKNMRPRSRSERIRSGVTYGHLTANLLMIILNFVLFVAAILNNLYFASIIPLSVCILFCIIFYFFYLRNINF